MYKEIYNISYNISIEVYTQSINSNDLLLLSDLGISLSPIVALMIVAMTFHIYSTTQSLLHSDFY